MVCPLLCREVSFLFLLLMLLRYAFSAHRAWKVCVVFVYGKYIWSRVEQVSEKLINQTSVTNERRHCWVYRFLKDTESVE